MSTDRWMGEWSALYIHTMDYSAYKKAGNSNICYTRGVPWQCYAKWDKRVTKRQSLSKNPKPLQSEIFLMANLSDKGYSICAMIPLLRGT